MPADAGDQCPECGEGVLVEMLSQTVVCGLCDYQQEVLLPAHYPNWYLFKAARYHALCHIAEVHPDEFRDIVGKEPVAAVAEYDQEMAELGITRLA